MMDDLTITLTYAELLALHSSVATISCVYGSNSIRESLLSSLETAIDIASSTNVVQIEIEA